MDLIKPAFFILKNYYQSPEKNLRLVLANYLDRVNPKDSQGITRTVYGMIRKEQILNQVIKRFSRIGLDQIEADTLILLKMGAYLLLFSSSYADHAVVSELVGFAESRVRSFLNGNLRAIIRGRDELIAMIKDLRELPIRFSISDLLIQNLKDISPNLVENLEYLNREPHFHLRVNSKDYHYDQIKEMLIEFKIDFKELQAFQSFEVKAYGKIIKELLKERFFYVQNTASQVVAVIASSFARGTVMDCCAAPGTKTATLRLLRPGLKIFANDISPQRVQIMKEFIEYFGLKEISILISDIRNRAIKREFEFIMVDAPCTSAGTLRKNPDLKLKIDTQMVEKSAWRQLEILQSLIPCIRQGGYLLYSVCSFVKEETEDILDQFNDCEEFAPIDLAGILDEYGFKYYRGEWGFYLLPNTYLNNDLFYISLLKKF